MVPSPLHRGLSCLAEVFAAALLVSSLAGAHPLAYPNGNSGESTLTTNGIPSHYVVFEPGHAIPNVLSRNTLWVTDTTAAEPEPVRAIYCQDLDEDGRCGGKPGDPPADDGLDLVTGWRGEPFVEFCGEVTIETPLDPTPRAPGGWAFGTGDGHNWDPGFRAYVFIVQGGAGNPTDPQPLCGPPASEQGSVDHDF